jgi:hypothetical protein
VSEPQHASPLSSQLILWIAFALLVVASVFTVLVPDFSDDPDANDRPRTRQRR